MEFVLSQKGERKVIYDGFVYVFQKNLANDLRSFECRRRRKGECKSKIKLNAMNEVVEEINEHTHLPSQPEVEILRVKSSIKRRAETTHETGQQILAGELQGLSEVASVNLPSMEHLRRTIRSQRHEHNNIPQPVHREGIPVLPLLYQQTSTGEPFLLYDSGIGDVNRIFIFATNQALDLLANSDDWFCDGTFKVCRKYFSNFTPSTQKKISVYFPVLLLCWQIKRRPLIAVFW